jgi:hypothetical protein
MQINLGLSPLSNVLGLINAKNGSSIVETQVTVDAVIESTENPGDNTKVTLTGIDGQGIQGSRSFYYGRYSLLGAKEPDPGRVNILGTDDQAQIEAKVCTTFGLKASEVEVSDVTIPASGNFTVATMMPVDNSLLYNGDPVDVHITLEGDVIPLSVAIPNTEFAGLTDGFVDLTKTGAQNLYRMINASYPWSFGSTVVTTSGLAVYSAEGSPANTSIQLNAVTDMGFSGSLTIHYKRLEINAQITPLPSSVTILEADTDAQVKAKVSAAYGVLNSAIQLSNVVRPTAGVPGSCDIRASSTSVLYTNTLYPVVLTL